MSHTAGPWEAGRPDMGTQSTVYGKWVYAGDRYIAMVSMDEDGDWDEVMDNARLVAASPDLLAACELWDQGFADGEDFTPAQFLAWVNKNRAAARAAVAKAKGEPT